MAATSKPSWTSTEAETHIGKDRERFIEIMRHAIALNGAFFNTQRMVAQYLHDAYRLGQAPVTQSLGSA